MTGIEVEDASALAAILFGEPEAVAERLTDARLAAPTLLDYELANVCLTGIRRQAGQLEGGIAARVIGIVAVLVAAGDGEDAGARNVGQAMCDAGRIARVGDQRGQQQQAIFGHGGCGPHVGVDCLASTLIE